MDNTNENQNPEEVNPTGELNGQQALNVLIQAVRIAQGKGAYTIEDAELISRAIKVFVPPTPVGEEGTTTDPIVNEETSTEPAEPVLTKVKK
tara:strand:+ start:869 stop:1144 length:276 start_codon:yes stop_codon:yes gene_type:complete